MISPTRTTGRFDPVILAGRKTLMKRPVREVNPFIERFINLDIQSSDVPLNGGNFKGESAAISTSC